VGVLRLVAVAPDCQHILMGLAGVRCGTPAMHSFMLLASCRECDQRWVGRSNHAQSKAWWWRCEAHRCRRADGFSGHVDDEMYARLRLEIVMKTVQTCVVS
jgi:hypothetical protein